MNYQNSIICLIMISLFILLFKRCFTYNGLVCQESSPKCQRANNFKKWYLNVNGSFLPSDIVQTTSHHIEKNCSVLVEQGVRMTNSLCIVGVCMVHGVFCQSWTSIQVWYGNCELVVIFRIISWIGPIGNHPNLPPDPIGFNCNVSVYASHAVLIQLSRFVLP